MSAFELPTSQHSTNPSPASPAHTIKSSSSLGSPSEGVESPRTFGDSRFVQHHISSNNNNNNNSSNNNNNNEEKVAVSLNPTGGGLIDILGNPDKFQV